MYGFSLSTTKRDYSCSSLQARGRPEGARLSNALCPVCVFSFYVAAV